MDFRGLDKVHTIEDHFLENCVSLTTVDLSDMIAVEAIGPYFLHGCSSLQWVKVPSKWDQCLSKVSPEVVEKMVRPS